MKNVLDGTNPLGIIWYHPYPLTNYVLTFQMQLVWDLYLKQESFHDHQLGNKDPIIPVSIPLLCGLHEVYSHTMVSPDLFIYLFIYLFVYESRASATWCSVVVLVVSLGSSNFF